MWSSILSMKPKEVRKSLMKFMEEDNANKLD